MDFKRYILTQDDRLPPAYFAPPTLVKTQIRKLKTFFPQEKTHFVHPIF